MKLAELAQFALKKWKIESGTGKMAYLCICQGWHYAGRPRQTYYL